MSQKLSMKAADHLRLFIKEMRWATYHLEKFYNEVKPEQAPIITVPKNQLELFENLKKDEL